VGAAAAVRAPPGACYRRAMSCLVVRYHEIALKGGNRQRFVGRLMDNLRDVTRGLGVRSVQSLPGRIALWLEVTANTEEIRARVSRTFGVANFSLAAETPPSLDAIAEAALAAVGKERFGSFRVTTRRADKAFPLTSPEINAVVGKRVQESTGAAVDLDHPELTVRIEVLPRVAFVSCRALPGPGGLPVTISGRVTCLLSGGIDSPVAAHRMMRRGCRVDLVHFHGAPYTNRASLEKAVDLAGQLTRFQLRTDFWSVPFGEIQAQIVARVPRTHRVVLYRRMMLRIATVLARRAKSRALVTGESLGQVASQTIENMSVIDAATTMLVLRPLVGMDKAEIIAEAERLGTFETSILPDQDCCSLFVPPHPTTHATPPEVAAAEAALDVETLVTEGLAGARHERFVYPPVASQREEDGTDAPRAHSRAAGAS
jgi:tRNA uracil 4-sulfurtransferase